MLISFLFVPLPFFLSHTFSPPSCFSLSTECGKGQRGYWNSVAKARRVALPGVWREEPRIWSSPRIKVDIENAICKSYLSFSSHPSLSQSFHSTEAGSIRWGPIVVSISFTLLLSLLLCILSFFSLPLRTVEAATRVHVIKYSTFSPDL